jgi:ketosteroid isomerase-like protein
MRPIKSVMTVVMLVSAIACGPSVDVQKEREALLALDREWSQTTKEPDRFVSYYAADARLYAPGMPLQTGTDAIRKAFGEMSAAPGFSLSWMASDADVSTSGDIGRVSGTYQATIGGATEKGKYLVLWKKQADGKWKVTDDIFNADEAPPAPPTQHVTAAPASLKWGDAPPGLPPGAKMAVVMGDPSQAGQPFVVRAQMPAGYKIMPHWHPTTESITVLSGAVAVGMGDKFDEPAMQAVPAGGFASVPAEMHHFFMTKAASTIQVHGIGPFAIMYVNPADDPSKRQN